jgi:hypothetical protein
MTKERDPLGKRALFSGAENGAGADNGMGAEPERATKPTPRRSSGPLDVTVTCSSCDVGSTLSAPEIALKHLPVVAWLPWRKRSLLMRCPACKRLAWHAVSRPT